MHRTLVAPRGLHHGGAVRSRGTQRGHSHARHGRHAPSGDRGGRPSLRALTQPVLERMFWKGSPFARHLEGLDVEEVLAAGKTFLDERPRPSSALAKHLGARWPDRDATALAYALRFLTPMIQVPPRGMWGASHQPTWATVDRWLGRPVPDDPTPDTAILDRFRRWSDAPITSRTCESQAAGIMGPCIGLRRRTSS